jgi:hypothetical protein
MALLSFSVLVVRAAQTGAKGMLLKDLLFLDMKGIYSEVCRITFSDEFAKLRKTTIGFVVSVLTSFRMEQLDSHWTDFHES